MIVKQLIKMLEKHNLEANITFRENPVMSIVSKYDCIHCEKDIIFNVPTLKND